MNINYDKRCKKILESRSNFKFNKIIKESKQSYSFVVEAVCEKGHISQKRIGNLIERGCSKCKGIEPKRYSKEEVISKLKDNNFKLLAWCGDTVRSPAILECMICGHEFKVQRLHPTLSGSGCKKCANQIKLLPHEIAERCGKNGWSLNWVEYQEEKYTQSYFHPRCLKCGTKHSGSALSRFIRGIATCTTCEPRVKGFDPNKPAILYYLRIIEDYKLYYKIGITNRSVNDRFLNEDLEKITVLSELHYEEGWKAQQLEKYFLNTFSEYRYKGEPILASGGNTELFVKDVLELDNP